ncbi:histidine phosphatase family protein [Hwanghaeella sp.]|uniref:histidine phosphatase family protein n=1 Tax=Hwanghaeella sp. TaxID=2605943 RepID=UPI003CCBC20E
MLPQRPFFYLRHGETDWNKQGLAQGTKDIPLNETGRRQAREAAASAPGLGIQRIVASPLDRAAETARTVGKAIGIEPVYDQGLIECSWGEREGDTLEPWFRDWLEGRLVIPGADILAEFTDRAAERIAQVLRADDRPTLIVAHGVVYRGIQKLFGWDQLTIPNGVILEHRPDGEAGWRVFMRK